MADKKQFTLSHYRELMGWLKKNNYVFIPFSQFRKSLGSYVLLRHDILFSPERALSLAVEEKKLGIKATYFIDLHNPWYNAFDVHVKRVLRTITDLGHYVGLHINPTFWGIPVSCFPMERVVVREKRMFEMYYPYYLNAVSFNRRWLQATVEYSGLVNADGEEVNRLYTFRSDQVGELDVSVAQSKSNIQLSLCPVWWTLEHMPPKKKVVSSIVNRMGKYYKGYCAGIGS